MGTELRPQLREQANDHRCENSFLLFLYPFHFDGNGYSSQLARVEALKGPTKGSDAKVWIKHEFAEDDLLPHVARYLNPEDGVSPTARLWHMDNTSLRSTAFLGAGAEWKLSTPHGDLPFAIESLQLALFRAGLGFLTLRIHLQADAVADWQNFIHYFRFMRRPHDVKLNVRRRTGIDPETREPILEDYHPAIIPRVNEDAKDRGLSPGEGLVPNLVMGEIVNALLRMARSDNTDQDWWREVFIPGQLIPFVSLFVNELPEGAAPSLLYKMRNFFHPLQGENPAPEDVRADHHSLLPYAERQWFTFSLDGGAFVGADVPDTQFFRQTLSDHLRDQYYLLFLLVQHQRFVLMGLSQQVSQY
jgi:hypothetical protein